MNPRWVSDEGHLLSGGRGVILGRQREYRRINSGRHRTHYCDVRVRRYSVHAHRPPGPAGWKVDLQHDEDGFDVETIFLKSLEGDVLEPRFRHMAVRKYPTGRID